MPECLESGTLFQRIHDVVARIPAGYVATYGQIAHQLGLWNGARTVGWAMRRCPAGIPWHRVVNAQGMISARGSGEGEALQRALLEEEGVPCRGPIDLSRYRWRPDPSDGDR
ncbi:MAG: MGMT family protein [Anaerolineae bacterium]|nr:methyltransferase [Chloroflexota bacterium]